MVVLFSHFFREAHAFPFWGSTTMLLLFFRGSTSTYVLPVEARTVFFPEEAQLCFPFSKKHNYASCGSTCCVFPFFEEAQFRFSLLRKHSCASHGKARVHIFLLKKHFFPPKPMEKPKNKPKKLKMRAEKKRKEKKLRAR